MKKNLFVALLTFLVVFSAIAHAEIPTDAFSGAIVSPDADDIQMDAAIQTAQATLPVTSNAAISATLIHNDNSSTSTWVVSFFEEGMPPPAGIVMLSASNGEVIASTTEMYITIQEDLEKERGNYYFWSLEDMAIFDAICKAPDTYPRCVLPSSEHIPQAEALEIAKNALAQRYSTSLDNLRIAVSFTQARISAENQMLQEQWVFSFRSDKANEYQATIHGVTGEVELLYSNRDANS